MTDSFLSFFFSQNVFGLTTLYFSIPGPDTLPLYPSPGLFSAPSCLGASLQDEQFHSQRKRNIAQQLDERTVPLTAEHLSALIRAFINITREL